jgi:hypothetical protein
VAKENRYTLTAQGQKFATALLSASAVDIKGLTKLAAEKSRIKNNVLKDCSTKGPDGMERSQTDPQMPNPTAERRREAFLPMLLA